MTVNNFDLIERYLSFEDDDTFYHLQLLKRRKDNPGMNSNNILIATYYVKSLEHFQNLKNDIIAICDATRARAYLNLNEKSFKLSSLDALKNLATSISNESYRNHRAFESAAGKVTKRDIKKKWIIDIDDMEWFEANKSELCKVIECCRPYGKKVLMVVPTVNGLHLITKPFNIKEFAEHSKQLCDLDIHKNNPTVLYCGRL